MCSEGIIDRYVNFYTDFAFKKLFGTEIAKFDKRERIEYEDSLKALRDWFSTMQTAELKGEARGLEQGRAEGRAEGERTKALEVARNLKSLGVSSADIAKAIGLTAEDIGKL